MTKGLLYKITKKRLFCGESPPVYLFGTIHLNIMGVDKLSSEARNAFLRSKILAIEYLPEDTNSEKINKLLQHWRSHYNFTENKLTDIRVDAITEAFYRYYYPNDNVITLRNEISDLLKNLSPEWARLKLWVKRLPPLYVMQMLSLIDSEEYLSTKTNQALDLQLHLRAMQLGKKVIGIESVDEHLSALYGLTFSPDEQESFFNMLYSERENCSKDEYKKIFSVLVDRYLNGTLNDTSSSAQFQNPAVHPNALIREAYDKRGWEVMDERNQNMANRIHRDYSRGGVFVAVGAAHLPGIIQKLSSFGYKIDAIDEGPRIHAIREFNIEDLHHKATRREIKAIPTTSTHSRVRKMFGMQEDKVVKHTNSLQFGLLASHRRHKRMHHHRDMVEDVVERRRYVR